MGRTDARTPAMLAFGLVALGIVIAALSGSVLRGSILGGIVAGLGAAPACFAMWKGIQQETQGQLAVAVLAVCVSLAVAGGLIVLRIIHWMT
ncbi:MAG: hypothetical protein AB7O24_19935 [Kofleriaceae bacterium]